MSTSKSPASASPVSSTDVFRVAIVAPRGGRPGRLAWGTGYRSAAHAVNAPGLHPPRAHRGLQQGRREQCVELELGRPLRELRLVDGGKVQRRRLPVARDIASLGAWPRDAMSVGAGVVPSIVGQRRDLASVGAMASPTGTPECGTPSALGLRRRDAARLEVAMAERRSLDGCSG